MVKLIKKTLRPVKHLIRPPCLLVHSFSQEGEDRILDRVFEEKTNGFYVDVGAHHPVHLSNTYYFYCRGWRGINIDAAPGSMSAFHQLRPHDINLEVGIGEEPGTLPFHIFNEATLSTFDPAVAKERDGVKHYRMMEVRPVKIRTLAQVLGGSFPAGMSIDFLSVDVEGFDLSVLRSNDWNRFRPAYVLAEDYTYGNVEEVLKSPIAVFLKSAGYVLFARTAHTEIYQRLRA